MRHNFTIFMTAFVLMGMLACKKKKDDEPTPDTGASVENQFLTNYANIAYSSYSESKMYASALKTAIDNFTANPTAVGLVACKDAYKFARLAYLQTEVYRGISGPIDSDGAAPETWINSWPLDEAYIDYVFANNKNTDTNKVSGQFDGIINDRSKDISKQILLGIYDNQRADDDVPTGFHAIEFLLWGQDIYAGGPGERPYTDYLTGAGATAPNADRRATYLKICAELLVENLGTVVTQWDPTVSGNYRADLLNTKNTSSWMSTIIAGMTKMSKNEFGSQRIINGIEGHSQEEEHSCFSDLTPMDFRYDVVGYSNVIEGNHTLQTGVLAISGLGLKDLVAKHSATNAAKIQAAVDSLNLTSIQSFNLTTPYDQILLRDHTDPDWQIENQMAYAWVQLSNALNSTSQVLGFGVVDTTPE